MAHGSSVHMYLTTLLILYAVLRVPSVDGKVTPWCGIIDYALVGRNYTTINATKNQKLCYQACLKDTPRCKSANYRPGDKECDLNNASHFDACVGGRLVKQSGSLYTFTASETMGCDTHPDTTAAKDCSIKNYAPYCQEDQRPEWQLVFKGVAGTGIKLYDLWTNTSWDSGSGDRGNFRNETLYHAWNNGQLSIRRVKLSLCNQTEVKVELVFNGTDSNTSSWFAKERLISSPWTDLTPTATANHFSIIGFLDKVNRHYRRFYINKSNSGCDEDHGWLAVIDSEGACPWESQPFSSYPIILYSNNGSIHYTVNATKDGTLGTADYLTVHIDTE